MTTEQTDTIKQFERYEVPRLCDRPDWWRVRVDEIEQTMHAAKKGTVEQIAVSAGGRPVLAITYGPPRAEPGTATWVSASASRDVTAYKTGETPQTVVLLAGVHGAEPEAVAGAVNLIALLETGRDLLGQAKPELLALCDRYRMVIVPCLNPDGRSISPDHLRGASTDHFRRASQGYWLDGSLVDYPTCKQYAPLPLDRVGFPGGYPNAAGYNIMHDVAPGDLRTDEARGLLKLVGDEQADLVLNMHSHSNGPVVLPASIMAYPLHRTRTAAYMQRVHDELAAADLSPAPVKPGAPGGGAINLNNAIALASGGLALTTEYPVVEAFSFEQMVEMFYVTVGCCLRHGLDEPFAPREAVARGRDA